MPRRVRSSDLIQIMRALPLVALLLVPVAVLVGHVILVRAEE